MIRNLFRKKNDPERFVQFYTYYIPAPPVRNTSYREREFDNVMSIIVQKGFEVIKIQTQGHQSPEQSGMWIICQLIARSEEAKSFDLNQIETNNEHGEITLDQEYTVIHE